MATTLIGSRTSMPVGTGQAAVVRPAIDRCVPVCDCGQAVDARPAGHCPRCGMTLVKTCRSGVTR